MMSVEEKLLELVCKSQSMKCDSPTGECSDCLKLVNHLIAHDVTVPEWISVKDRLPDCSGKYLVCTNRGNVYQTKFYSYPEGTGGHWGQKDKGKSITHWMRLPQPPKE